MEIKANFFDKLTGRAQMMSQIADLSKKVTEYQSLIVNDILSLTEATTTYRGNAYDSYDIAVQEISDKYNGVADWGVLQTGNIIDLRAAFIINQGVTVTKKEKGAVKELEFCGNFMQHNNLDNEICQAWAIEGEIEGRLLVQLTWDEAEKMVNARFISWSDKTYKVVTNPDDYADITGITWEAKGNKQAGNLKPPEFAYKKFGGRINRPDTPAPKMMKCLTQIDNLDKALRDWREINNLFAAPVPDVECETADEAQEARNELQDKNIGKLRKAFIHTGKFSFKGPDMKGVESIENEIISLAKMISGTTGVPIHYLGLTDLLKQRATADNLREMVNAATTKERETWIGAYEEMFDKAMAIYNEKMTAQKSKEAQLDSSKIEVTIPIVTAEQWTRIEKVFLPAVVAGKISKELFLRQIPGIDVEAELKASEKAEKVKLDKIEKTWDETKIQTLNEKAAELKTPQIGDQNAI